MSLNIGNASFSDSSTDYSYGQDYYSQSSNGDGIIDSTAEAAEALLPYFDEINRRGSYIGKGDLRKAAKNENLPPEVRAAAQFLLKNKDERSELAGMINDKGGDKKISRADLEAAANGQLEIIDTTEEAAEALLPYFDDLNKNGEYLGKGDLRKAAKDDSLPIEVRAAAQFLLKNDDARRKLSSVVNDNGGDKKISKADLEAVAFGIDTPAEAAEALLPHFDELNRHGNYLGKADLRKAAKDDNLPVEVRAAAQYLLKNDDARNELSSIINDTGGDKKISKADLEAAALGIDTLHEAANAILPHFDELNREGQYLGKGDLRKAAKDDSLPIEVRAAAQFLLKNEEARLELAKLINDNGGDTKISKDDLVAATFEDPRMMSV